MSPGVHVQRAQELDDYISANPESKLDRTEPYEIAGQRRDLDVYRCPVDYFVYNIRNGRFAAELREREGDLGVILNPENPEDAKEIEGLLLNDKKQAQFLMRDMKRVGQMRPGAVTHDGSIIDGNRRIAVLRRLYAKEKDEKWNFFEAARLPPNISAEDLWRIEAGIQLSYDLKAAYGPINELLKIREGRDAGLSYAMISVVLGGDNTRQTIKEKEKRLDLIEDYLAYIKFPLKYSEAERTHEHFIDLQKIKNREGFTKLSPPEQTEFIHRAYEMIRVGISHLDIRQLGKVVSETDAVRDLMVEAKKVTQPGEIETAEKPEPPELTLEGTVEILGEILVEEETEEPAENGEEDSPLPKPRKMPGARKAEIRRDPELKRELKVVLENAVDIVDIRKKARKPKQLLKKATTTVRALEGLSDEDLGKFAEEIEALTQRLGAILNRLKG